MPLILGTNSIKDTGFDVANSLRFNDGSSDHLNRTPSSSGNRKTWTWSSWVKKSTIGSGYQFLFSCTDASTSTGSIGTNYDGDNKIYFRDDLISLNLTPNAVHRDTSAWSHIVVALDTTQSTASNRAKMYINGTQVTSFSTETYPSQNTDGSINLVSGSYVHRIGSYSASGNFFDGYLAETVFIDGTALDPTSFGEFDEDSGIWKPKNVSGLTFGTNGFYLDFENSGSLGADVSGNGNNFTVNNLTSIDQSTDTCTNNFCTLNPLSKGTITLAEGNLQWQGSGDNGGKGTFLITKGKWYWEMKRGDSENAVGLGVAISNWTNTVDASSGEAWFGYHGQGYKVSGTGGEVSYGTSFTNNDIISVLFNADDGILAFYKNGVSQGNAFTGLTDSEGYVPIYFTFRTSVTNYMNFGSPIHSISSGNSDANGYGNFEYAVPSSYYSLCTKNLAEYG